MNLKLFKLCKKSSLGPELIPPSSSRGRIHPHCLILGFQIPSFRLFANFSVGEIITKWIISKGRRHTGQHAMDRLRHDQLSGPVSPSVCSVNYLLFLRIFIVETCQISHHLSSVPPLLHIQTNISSEMFGDFYIKILWTKDPQNENFTSEPFLPCLKLSRSCHMPST